MCKKTLLKYLMLGPLKTRFTKQNYIGTQKYLWNCNLCKNFLKLLHLIVFKDVHTRRRARRQLSTLMFKLYIGAQKILMDLLTYVLQILSLYLCKNFLKLLHLIVFKDVHTRRRVRRQLRTLMFAQGKTTIYLVKR